MKQEKIIKKVFESVLNEKEITQYTIEYNGVTLVTTDEEYALYIDNLINKGLKITPIRTGAYIMLLVIPEIENYNGMFTKRFVDRFMIDKYRYYGDHENFPKEAGTYIGINEIQYGDSECLCWSSAESYLKELSSIISDVNNNL